MPSISIVARDPTPAEAEISDLLKQATAQADDKDYDAAVASLRRAYSLMESVATEWPIRTYFRLARYLHLSGNYDAAVQWLRSPLDNLDQRFDAREALYKEWGWMQSKGKYATISKEVRKNVKNVIRNELVVFAERQHKIEARAKKAAARAK